MKKLFFAFMTIGILASGTSCKKCGYCKYSNGQGNGSSVCQSNSIIPGVPTEYDETKSDCAANNGTWTTTN
jgi:hypothetical protein